MRRALQLEVRPYRLRLREPVRGVAERVGFVIRLEEAAGGGVARVGLGEACIVPEVGTESFEQAALALQRPPLRLDELEALAATPAARHAVELALLDLAAQREGVPLARMLAAGAPLEVEVSALLVSQGMAELAREAAGAAASGFRTLKLKVSAGDAYARTAVVRDAVGPGVRLRLDANGAWTAPEALRLLRELAPLGIELCEQPTADLRGLDGAAVTIAADELCKSDPDGAIERAGAIVLKPMALGGLLPALRLAARARGRGLATLVTSSLDGAIARAGAAHLAAALLAHGPQPAAGLATGALLLEDLCADPLAPRGGLISLSTAPGLGLSLATASLTEVLARAPGPGRP